MKIDIVCSSESHPINSWLEEWQRRRQDNHEIAIFRNADQLLGGDVLFIISCVEIIGDEVREQYKNSLVVHASDLPKGRGWSPHVWEILNGATKITVSLISADEPVDSGAIWDKITIGVPKHALYDEINETLFRTELELMDRGIEMIQNGSSPQAQNENGGTYWPRRDPEDSEIDPHSSIASQFDNIRVSDSERYPAWFRLHGHKYTIEVRKVGKDGSDND